MLYKLLLDQRHIFDEGGIEEVLSEQVMDEEHETNVVISGEPHAATSERQRGGSNEETSSDDSSNGSDGFDSNEYNDDPFNFIDKIDMATSKSVTSTSLGINLELVLEISQEDMLMDEASTPWDE